MIELHILLLMLINYQININNYQIGMITMLQNRWLQSGTASASFERLYIYENCSASVFKIQPYCNFVDRSSWENFWEPREMLDNIYCWKDWKVLVNFVQSSFGFDTCIIVYTAKIINLKLLPIGRFKRNRNI